MPRSTFSATTALAAALAIAACGSGQAGDGAGDAPPPGQDRERAAAVDAHFVAQMIPHHESAVEMGEVARGRAEHSEVSRLAEDIVRTQKEEIRELRALQDDLDPATGAPPRGMGMMGGEDLGALREADPFDRAFIDAMVPHHLMAVHMSQMVRRAGRDARVRQLAARIEAAQRREIEQMDDWRERWYGAPVEGGGPGAGHAPCRAWARAAVRTTGWAHPPETGTASCSRPPPALGPPTAPAHAGRPG
jgi:uncharacterized protein (DUF305 family)